MKSCCFLLFLDSFGSSNLRIYIITGWNEGPKLQKNNRVPLELIPLTSKYNVTFKALWSWRLVNSVLISGQQLRVTSQFPIQLVNSETEKFRTFQKSKNSSKRG